MQLSYTQSDLSWGYFKIVARLAKSAQTEAAVSKEFRKLGDVPPFLALQLPYARELDWPEFITHEFELKRRETIQWLLKRSESNFDRKVQLERYLTLREQSSLSASKSRFSEEFDATWRLLSPWLEMLENEFRSKGRFTSSGVSLTHLDIEGFRCFDRVNVELRPLTVLIGANNTGKSAFLTAILSLGGVYKIRSSDVFKQLEDIDLLAKIVGKEEVNGRFREYHSFFTDGDRRFDDLSKWISAISLTQLPSYGATSICDGISSLSSPPILEGDGSNLPAVLDFMLRNDRRRFQQLLDFLKTTIPGFEDLNIQTPKSDQRQLVIAMDKGRIFRGDEVSTGVRHLIYFATLAFHPNPPDVILIEEPESGVHPKRLGDIVSLLRGISLGSHEGTPSQVIISTHSPFLLDAIDLDIDQVLVFRRENTPDGRRTVDPVDRDRLKNFLEDFMLGEIWYNQEEQGLVSKKK